MSTELHDIQAIKQASRTYAFHEIEDRTLEIGWIEGNKEDFGSTFYPIDQFQDWVRDEYAEHGLVWLHPTPTQYVSNPLPYALEVDEYISENEKELVKEFFNKFK